MINEKIKILAIESSCDETSASIIEAENSKSEIRNPKILSNIVSSQIDLHAKTGGVVPEVASRAHMEAIIPVIEQALEKSAVGSRQSAAEPLTANDKLLTGITHIAVTAGPGLIGSLLVGFNTAKALAYSLNIPIIPINHIEGHIYSAFAESPKSKVKSQKSDSYKLTAESFPLLALTVSGGHTSLTLMKDHGVYENIGSTLDDAAGEAFDKVAKLIDLGYPGGPIVSKLAKQFRSQQSKTANCQPPTANITFPRPILNDGTFNFSFSGLKTAVLTYVKKLEAESYKLTADDKSAICCAFEDAVVDVLVTKTLRAAEKYQPKAVILAGGVAANNHLREKLSEAVNNLAMKQFSNLKLLVPPITLTGDNAAMIGVAAYYHILKNNIKTWDQISVDSNLKL